MKKICKPRWQRQCLEKSYHCHVDAMKYKVQMDRTQKKVEFHFHDVHPSRLLQFENMNLESAAKKNLSSSSYSVLQNRSKWKRIKKFKIIKLDITCCKYFAAIETLLKKQNPIAWSYSEWCPGGRIHAKPLRTFPSAT